MPRRYPVFAPPTYGDPMVFTTTRHLHDHAGITIGNGGLDRMRGEGRDGRGNLRENREDPAPTVGRLRGYRCGGLPHRPPFTSHGHQWEGVKVDHDPARRVATVFEKWDCEIKTVLP